MNEKNNLKSGKEYEAYLPPMIEIFDIYVEQGFAQSDINADQTEGYDKVDGLW